MHSRDPHALESSRPLGLRFVIELANAPSPADSWSALCSAHGDPLFGRLRVSSSALADAVTRVRHVLAQHEPRAAAAILNALLAASDTPTELTELADGRWALRPSVTATTTAADAYLRVAAFSFASWFAERGRCAWGVCAASDCENAFIDEGRRAPQRFCSTACATRTRVAAHRRSAAAGRGQGPGNSA